MTDKELLAGARQFFIGKDFFIDTFYSKRLQSDYKVVCYTIDGHPDYIRADQLENMASML